MMKKMRLFRRITATAMVFAMVGITSAFAASSESYGSMTNGKGEIDHIILNSRKATYSCLDVNLVWFTSRCS